MHLFINILLPGLLVLILGFILGVSYFSFLWLTVQKLPNTKHPILLILGSGVMRLGIALGGFYFITDGHWEHLLIAFIGFLLARKLLIHRWQPQTSLANLVLEG